MNTPSLEFYRFGMGCLLGVGLGIVYGFLSPLRPKHTLFADSLFLLCLIWAWLYQGFAVCQGDLRLGYYAGFPLGAWVWLKTLGRLLFSVFTLFWKGLSLLLQGFAYPVKIILKKIKKFFIFLLASAKKTGTIKSNNDDRIQGGAEDGKQKKLFQPYSAKISSQLPSAQVRGFGSRGGIHDLFNGAAERNSGE